jgi:hypothetical protein
MEGALKARHGGGAKKGLAWTEDGDLDIEEIGKVAEKLNKQAKNYREITSKYKINTEQKDWQDKKNYVEIKAKHGKANTNKENNRRYTQAGGHELVKNR